MAERPQVYTVLQTRIKTNTNLTSQDTRHDMTHFCYITDTEHLK